MDSSKITANFTDVAVGGPLANLQIVKKNHFNAVGPSLGTDWEWKMGAGWSLDGGVGIAFLYGRFNTYLNSEIAISTESITSSSPDNFNRLSPNANGYVGIHWERCFCDRFFLMIYADYETQYWWNQWQAPSGTSGNLFGATPSASGDLALQGLTLGASFSF